MRILSFPVNMMKARERKVMDPREQTDSFISSRFASMVHGTLVLESQPNFNVQAAYYWWKRGAKKSRFPVSLP